MTDIRRDDDWRAHLIDDDDGIRRVLERHASHRGARHQDRSGRSLRTSCPSTRSASGSRSFRFPSTIPKSPRSSASLSIDASPRSRRRRHGQRVSPRHDVPPHVDDIIAKKPKSVWMQLGIRNDAAAERLARAGIDVVQDRCLMVELRRPRRDERSAIDDQLRRARVERPAAPREACGVRLARATANRRLNSSASPTAFARSTKLSLGSAGASDPRRAA